MPRWWLTLCRSVLLSLFVLGGPGLPLVDALVWHGSGTQQVAGSRINAPDTARTHADSCSLAAPIPVPGPVPCAVPPTLAFQRAERISPVRPQFVRSSAAPDRNARPRAPPIISA